MEITNGTPGTLRDLKVRSLIATVPQKADDAAADADSAIPSGGFYRTVAGGRTVFQKP
jgi:hypothetical protein